MAQIAKPLLISINQLATNVEDAIAQVDQFDLDPTAMHRHFEFMRAAQ